MRGVGFDSGNNAVLAFQFGWRCMMGKIRAHKSQARYARRRGEEARAIHCVDIIAPQEIEHSKERAHRLGTTLIE